MSDVPTDDDLSVLRSAFGDPVVGPFVEEFEQGFSNGTIQVNCSELHSFFTRIYDAGFRDALPSTTDLERVKAFRSRIEGRTER